MSQNNQPEYPFESPPENPMNLDYDPNPSYQTYDPLMSRNISQAQTPPQYPQQYDSQYQFQHPSKTANDVEENQSFPGSPSRGEPSYVQNSEATVPSSATNIISYGTKEKLNTFVEAISDDIRSKIGSELLDGHNITRETRDERMESNIVFGVQGTPQANVNNAFIDNIGGYYPNTVPNSRTNNGPDPRMSMTNNYEVNPGQMKGQPSGQFVRNSMTTAVPPPALVNNMNPRNVPYSRNSITNNTMPIPGEVNPNAIAQANVGPNTGTITQRNSFSQNLSPNIIPGSRQSNAVSPNPGSMSRHSGTNNLSPNAVPLSRNSIPNTVMPDTTMAQRTSQVNNIIREASQVLRESQLVLQETSPQIVGIRNSVSAPLDGKLFRLSEERTVNGKDSQQFPGKKVTLNLNEIVAKSDGKKLYLEIPLDAEGRVVASFAPSNETPGARWKTTSCLESSSHRRKCNKPCCVRREPSTENTQSNECYDPCSGESNPTGEYTDTYSEKNSKSLNTASEGFTSGDKCGCSNSKTICRKKNKDESKFPREHVSQTFIHSCCHDCTTKRDSCANICCCQSCADSTESSDGCVSEYSTECVEVSCSNDLIPGTVVSTKRKITRKCVQFLAGNSDDCVSESGSPV